MNNVIFYQFCIICFKRERCIDDYFHQYFDALGNIGEFYIHPLAGNPIRYGAHVARVSKLKSFIKIICKMGVLSLLEILQTTLASVQMPVAQLWNGENRSQVRASSPKVQTILPRSI